MDKIIKNLTGCDDNYFKGIEQMKKNHAAKKLNDCTKEYV